MREAVFGIDFGTTNTRVAHFDGQNVRLVPARGRRGLSVLIPTVVGCVNGKPKYFGQEALERDDCYRIHGLKWHLNTERPIEVGGYRVDAVDVAAAFFGYLRSVVQDAQLMTPFERIVLTVPVNYPFQATDRLIKACSKADIDVVGIYPEPVAALYAATSLQRVSGVAAVFDWGGGTLDIATVRVEDGWAQVLFLDGIKKGGTDFDRSLLQWALRRFAAKHHDLSFDIDALLAHKKTPLLLEQAQFAKQKLTDVKHAAVTLMGLVGSRNLDEEITRQEFEALIQPDVQDAVAALSRAIRNSEVSEKFVSPILLSGGTSRIPIIQSIVEQRFGLSNVQTTLQNLPQNLRNHPNETDIQHATALGAVLLYMSVARPVFSRDIGIRMAVDADSRDAFYTLYRKGDVVDIDRKQTAEFFVTRTEGGVARILICDRLSDVMAPGGRLLKIFPVPINNRVTYLSVQHWIDEKLAINISVRDVMGTIQPMSCAVADLSLGFKTQSEVASLIASHAV